MKEEFGMENRDAEIRRVELDPKESHPPVEAARLLMLTSMPSLSRKEREDRASNAVAAIIEACIYVMREKDKIEVKEDRNPQTSFNLEDHKEYIDAVDELARAKDEIDRLWTLHDNSIKRCINLQSENYMFKDMNEELSAKLLIISTALDE